LTLRLHNGFNAVRYHVPFIVADIGDLDVILRCPWLEQEEPCVRWQEKAWAYRFQKVFVCFAATKKELRRAVAEACISGKD